MRETMNRIAVVILNYKSAEKCRNCVLQLKRQTGIALQIIVVDNGSGNNECSQLEEFCATENVLLLKSDSNLGYSAGNNIGLRYAVEVGGV